jgi:hypothetical protein
MAWTETPDSTEVSRDLVSTLSTPALSVGCQAFRTSSECMP